MPTVLRLVYSRFAVQEILSGKLDPEEQAPPPDDHEYVPVELEMDTVSQTDQIPGKPVDV